MLSREVGDGSQPAPRAVLLLIPGLSLLIKDHYLFNCANYIENNPVRAKRVPNLKIINGQVTKDEM
jgi:hypothetical protein